MNNKMICEENLDEELLADGFFIPKCVDYSASQDIFKDCTEVMKKVAIRLRNDGWTFYAVNQQRGRCYYKGRVITIPVWAMVRSIRYKQWYVSHEMAHAVAGSKANHGPDFMAALRRICPESAIHHELSYKPRNATSAGIVHPNALDF